MLFLINSEDETIFEDYFKRNIEIIKQINLLIIMGGDGTIHTILTKFLNENIIIPVAIVPLGSGNGLFKSITYETKKESSLLESIKIIKQFISNKTNDKTNDKTNYLSKHTMHANLIKVKDNNNLNKNLNSLLAVSWGFISDVDIKTEYMRGIGSLRFDLGAIYYLMKKKLYKGTFKYKNDNDEIVTIKGDFFHFQHVIVAGPVKILFRPQCLD